MFSRTVQSQFHIPQCNSAKELGHLTAICPQGQKSVCFVLSRWLERILTQRTASRRGHKWPTENSPCLLTAALPSCHQQEALCQGKVGENPPSTKRFPYLVIDGIKLGEHNSINEPGRLGHGVVSQGLVELDLRKRTSSRNEDVSPTPSETPIKPTQICPSQKATPHTHQLIHSLVSHQSLSNKKDQIRSIDGNEFCQGCHQGGIVLHAARCVHQHHVEALVTSCGDTEKA